MKNIFSKFWKSLVLISAGITPAFAATGESNIWVDYGIKYGISLGWILISTLGFSIALGVGLKIFDFFSRNIDESAELKRRNYGVAIIFAVFIIMVALIVSKVIKSY